MTRGEIEITGNLKATRRLLRRENERHSEGKPLFLQTGMGTSLGGLDILRPLSSEDLNDHDEVGGPLTTLFSEA